MSYHEMPLKELMRVMSLECELNGVNRLVLVMQRVYAKRYGMIVKRKRFICL